MEPAEKNEMVGEMVLSFYKELPFNYHNTVKDSIRAVKEINTVQAAYPFLLPFIKKNTRVLEVGSGVGWFSNGLCYHYGCDVTGIDFNPVAVKRANDVAQTLDLKGVHFQVADLFEYYTDTPFEVVISLGVLHHTDDCLHALRHIIKDLLKPGGYIMIGLYHLYGRKAFLDHFSDMKKNGASEQEMLARFRTLHSQLTNDETHVISWFRDQVLHPHETQHTMKEICPMLQENSMQLLSCSINRFQTITSLDAIYEEEKSYAALGAEKLRDGKYFPGFFVFFAQKEW